MADEVGGGNILEAMRLYEQYKRQYGQAGGGGDTAIQGASALERAIPAVIEGVGRPAAAVMQGAAHVLGAPARALAAGATNLAGTQAPVSVLDAAIYGQDMESGRGYTHYGDLLAGTLEDSGEVAKGSMASKIIAAAGNMITDPAMAPVLMSGAEAAGSLAGRATPTVSPMGSNRPPRMPPRGRVYPQYQGGPGMAPGQAGAPGGTGPGPGQTPWGGQKLPYPNLNGPRNPWDPTATQPIRPNPNATQPVKTFDPNATQPVRGTARVGGELPDTATQPVKTIKPKKTGGGPIEERFAAEKAKHGNAPKKGPKPDKSIEGNAKKAGMTKKGGEPPKKGKSIEEQYAEHQKKAKKAKEEGKTFKPRTKKKK